uniref:Protein Wnt n=1 Tax=Macrostomum lignano TaxID=282301 RepID=A0A1I8F698_9PLAT
PRHWLRAAWICMRNAEKAENYPASELSKNCTAMLPVNNSAQDKQKETLDVESQKHTSRLRSANRVHRPIGAAANACESAIRPCASDDSDLVYQRNCRHSSGSGHFSCCCLLRQSRPRRRQRRRRYLLQPMVTRCAALGQARLKRSLALNG